jgi:hypothetical protein
MQLDDTKLFDFVKIMFTKKADYANIKEQTKRRHHFMINRFFAIKFPANAQMFNKNGINGASVIDSWSLVAQRFTSVPMWIYTKTKKAAPKKDEYIPNDDALELFMKIHEIGKREYNELKKFSPDELEKELRKLETTIKVY